MRESGTLVPEDGKSLIRAAGRAVPKSVTGWLIRRIYHRIEPELTILSEFLAGGGTAVDVGSWFGPWAQRLMSRADRVVAIEAAPGMADYLRRTFPRAHVVHAAASSECGQAELWSPPDGEVVGISSLDHHHGTPVTVPMITLDSLGLTDVRFIKLDIEGHELPALLGAEVTVRRDRPLLLLELETRHQQVEPVVDLLAAWGYDAFVLPEDEWIPLADFDLLVNQRETVRQLERNTLSRALFPGRRYVNSVLFRPATPVERSPMLS